MRSIRYLRSNAIALSCKDFDFDDKRIDGQFIFASGSQVVTVSLHASDADAAGCDVRATTKQAWSA